MSLTKTPVFILFGPVKYSELMFKIESQLTLVHYRHEGRKITTLLTEDKPDFPPLHPLAQITDVSISTSIMYMDGRTTRHHYSAWSGEGPIDIKKILELIKTSQLVIPTEARKFG